MEARRSDDQTPAKGTKTMVPCPRTVEIPERRSKFRLYLHVLLDIGKIACLIATAHLLIKLTIMVPAILEEVKRQTALIQDSHNYLTHSRAK